MNHHPKSKDDDGPGLMVLIIAILATIFFSILKTATK